MGWLMGRGRILPAIVHSGSERNFFCASSIRSFYNPPGSAQTTRGALPPSHHSPPLRDDGRKPASLLTLRPICAPGRAYPSMKSYRLRRASPAIDRLSTPQYVQSECASGAASSSARYCLHLPAWRSGRCGGVLSSARARGRRCTRGTAPVSRRVACKRGGVHIRTLSISKLDSYRR